MLQTETIEVGANQRCHWCHQMKSLKILWFYITKLTFLDLDMWLGGNWACLEGAMLIPLKIVEAFVFLFGEREECFAWAVK